MARGQCPVIAEFTALLEAVPAGVWAVATVACLSLAMATWSSARRRVRRAGELVAAPRSRRVRDTALTVASLVPAGLFWLMVLGGSFHGLVAFGRTTLGWTDGWEYLVPGTLDGVSVTFAMLAFRAVKRGKTPDRCYRVVWGAAAASATINFGNEYGTSGNALAGGYVGLLSLFGMVMFDEFLNQFEEGAATLRRENPKFGIRWLTWPSNTFCTAIAWRNHPPPDGTPGTVLNAIANLERVRAAKRASRRTTRTSRGVHLGSGAPSSGHPVAPLRDHSGELRGSPPARSAAVSADVTRPDSRAIRGRGRRSTDDEAWVPTTASTLAQWAKIWIQMSQHPDLAARALKNDEPAREHFGCTARKLRHVRYAATTGALRRRAEELSVDLPDGYVDTAPPGPSQ